MPLQTELLSLSNQELTALVRELGEPAYRGRQIADAIFRQRRVSLKGVSNLPPNLEARLSELGAEVGFPEIQQKFTSMDGTVRYLMRFSDGESVETVWMPEGDYGEAGDGSEAGNEESPEAPKPRSCKQSSEAPKPRSCEADSLSEHKHFVSYLDSLSEAKRKSRKIGRRGDGVASGLRGFAASGLGPRSFAASQLRSCRSRATICVSSQVGCAVNCQFCLTALLGVKRNLSAGEIVGQVLAVLQDHSVDLQRERMNIVFMGMGEPFLNYDNFMKAVRLLVEEVRFPESRMTVSTAGIVPRIHDFGQEPIRPKLAISLNAPNDEIRERIMPVTRKWNVEALLEAARNFPLRPRERLTFEYVLLHGVNDAPEHARELAQRVRDIRCKVNLIALNPGPGIDFEMPEQDSVVSFQKTLIESGIPAFIRRPRGRDIYAACGQLKRTVE